MGCLQSFSFVSSASANISGASLDTWGLAPQNYWTGTKFGTSVFTFQGFKSVDIYSIQAVGDVTVLQGTGNAAIVNDWSFFIQLNGTFPLVSGNVQVTPNDFSIQRSSPNPNIVLNRYNTLCKFSSPIRSVSSIGIGGIRASGIGAENLLAVDLVWEMTFVVNYLYEGEDTQFALL